MAPASSASWSWSRLRVPLTTMARSIGHGGSSRQHGLDRWPPRPTLRRGPAPGQPVAVADHGLHRQLVGPLVHLVAGVALDPAGTTPRRSRACTLATSGSHRSRLATGLRWLFFQSRASQPSYQRSRKQLTT